MRGRSLKKLPSFRKRKRRSYGRKSVRRAPQRRSVSGQRRPRSRYGRARVAGDQALLPIVGAGLLMYGGYKVTELALKEIWG